MTSAVKRKSNEILSITRRNANFIHQRIEFILELIEAPGASNKRRIALVRQASVGAMCDPVNATVEHLGHSYLVIVIGVTHVRRYIKNPRKTVLYGTFVRRGRQYRCAVVRVIRAGRRPPI